jgi:hypothetical protein
MRLEQLGLCPLVVQGPPGRPSLSGQRHPLPRVYADLALCGRRGSGVLSSARDADGIVSVRLEHIGDRFHGGELLIAIGNQAEGKTIE